MKKPLSLLFATVVIAALVLLAAVGFDTWQKNHKASKSRKPATQGAVAA